MAITYKLHNIPQTTTSVSVSMYDNENFIHCVPFDPDNKDYQEYLKWLEAGNTPLPADE